MPSERDILLTSKAWPVTEALKVLKRVERTPPKKGFVLFETGYGPSGLPHIGTFGEVFRTTLVRQIFTRLSDLPTELYAFSDDMDGLRKVPDNIPNAAMVAQYLGKPLTEIPDPFGTHESYGHHMNARLQAFLDAFGFPYTFKSATACYRAGLFNETLLRVLAHHEEVKGVVMPYLGEERRATYSPILPISPKTGKVLQVPLVECRVDAGTVVFEDEDGSLTEVPVTDGHCKLQWRADWALRWTALEVDYEMSGKDLIDSVKLGSRICRVLGGHPPEGFHYELFLDEQGQKISKSKGNGLTIDEWLRYGTRESLALFMYRDPKAAKRLYFDVIPRNVDDYEQFLDAFAGQQTKERIGNPVWHIHNGQPPEDRVPAGLSFMMLLNLASVVNADEPGILWGFISRYAPGVTPDSSPKLMQLVEGAIAYYRAFVLPEKKYRAPDDRERQALKELAAWLDMAPDDSTAEAIQFELYEIGKRHGFESLKNWFRACYEVLLGQEEGPRLGTFVRIYGPALTRKLILDRLAESGAV